MLSFFVRLFGRSEETDITIQEKHMQKRNTTGRHHMVTFTLAVVLAAATTASAAPFSDFEEGTLQGWTPIASPISGTSFGGFLEHVSTGGNPGGYMRAIDTVAAGGPLYVAGPSEFRGDLRGYSEVRWDEFLFQTGGVVQSTSALLIGPDNTVYASDDPVAPTGEWRTRSVLLESESWSLLAGSMSFEDVLQDGWLAFNMDVSVASQPTLESGIDNVMLIPEPTTFAILGLAGLGVRKRRVIR
jgi:hypothetical protein